MLKIFAQAPGTPAPETHVFSFTSQATARAEADAIKDALSKAIQSAKSGGLPLAIPGGDASAAMAIASAVSSGAQGNGGADALYDDSKLRSDVELQQSLLKADASLSKTFMESLRAKPESISSSQFASQFWSTRVHLLRAHAVERIQLRGQYNVLSTIRPIRGTDNATRLSISKEQIQLIFNQHSLIKRVYDENVPKLSEEIFWSRFFQSRLFKKLKGERITENDPPDNVLDKYLSVDEDAERAARLMAAHIPHIIDIEGNEENHSQRKGNAPDWTMRPSNKVPIFRTLNTLSEKIMSHVAPNDIDPSLPIGVDEETFNSLALRDLQGDPEENQRILNIKDQSRFFASDKESGVSEDALKFAKQDPAKVLQAVQKDLASLATHNTLETAIGVDPDSDSEDDENGPPKTPHVGSHAAISAATAQIMAAISQQRVQSDDLASSTSGFSTVQSSSTHGLSTAIFDRLSITHATTTEFLQHFWSVFLSGDASRAEELSKLVETLDRAMDRIKAVADDAEADRKVEMQKMRRQAQDYYERTKRKVNPDYEGVKGGAKVVNQLMGPTVRAIERASGDYRKAVLEQTGEARDGSWVVVEKGWI